MGKLNSRAKAGDEIIKVGITSPCTGEAVSQPEDSGCFRKSDGDPDENLKIKGDDLGNVTEVQLRWRTLAGFSTAAERSTQAALRAPLAARTAGFSTGWLRSDARTLNVSDEHCRSQQTDLESLHQWQEEPRRRKGTLRYAYKTSVGKGGPKDKAEGVAFLGAFLPRLHNCSAEDADTVRRLMWIDGTMESEDSFSTVKTLLERNYACMGVTCSQVGALLDE